MRAEQLHARSILIVEAAIVGGYAVVLAVVAFTRFLGLIINDDWLGPLMMAMGIEFISGCLLASKMRRLNWGTISASLTIKVLLVLSVAMGFTVQRMNINDPTAMPWGHYTIASAIGFEIFRFTSVLKAFGVPLGPFGAMLDWVHSQFRTPVEEYRTRAKMDKAAHAERRAALNEYYDTGKPGSQPVVNTLSGEDIPESGSDVESVEYTDGDE